MNLQKSKDFHLCANLIFNESKGHIFDVTMIITHAEKYALTVALFKT